MLAKRPAGQPFDDRARSSRQNATDPAACYLFDMVRDDANDETFARVVGTRVRPPGLPPRATRDAMTAMAQYRTRAPKGVFRYASHEEANADRLAWTVAAMADAERERKR
jgi:hypothetical protein